MTEKQLAAIIARGKKRREKERVFSMNITREQGLYIKYRLRLKGKSLVAIAWQLNCSCSTVTQVLAGQNIQSVLKK